MVPDVVFCCFPRTTALAYLTKSRFKIALTCPTRLEYALQKDLYHNAQAEDPFMQALAEGGHQVGALAKLHFPGGKDCTERQHNAALEQTRAWIESGVQVIFEAALLSGHKFIRVDVLELTPNEIRVIEVKAKGLDGPDPQQFFGKRGGIQSSWRPYLEDVAFQVEVARAFFRARGDSRPVRGFLMGPDKTAEATHSGLHQHFRIVREGGRSECVVRPGTTLDHLGAGLMVSVNVQQALEHILDDGESYQKPGWSSSDFLGAIHWFEDLHRRQEEGEPIPLAPLTWNCKSCPFHTPLEQPMNGKKSGRARCFEHHLKWENQEHLGPKIWEVHRAKSTWSEQGKWRLSDLTKEDIGEVVDPRQLPAGKPLKTPQRQWIQVAGSQENHPDFGRTYLDVVGIQQEVAQFRWPLHLIDFETTAPALPFFEGYSPYEGLPFQFSHHILHRDGRVEHAHEFLGMGQGEDPTFEFIRQLHAALSEDDGSIFMYSHHENTYLRYARRQLLALSPYSETETQTLVAFIEAIARPSSSHPDEWVPGDRQMVDLAKTVKKWFWHPHMKGSNSIKKVLPAVLEASPYLQERYGRARYGTSEIPSLNFAPTQWFKIGLDGKAMDPYSILPEIQEGQWASVLSDVEALYDEESVANGGAAMTAWAYMQFAEMSNPERQALRGMLLQYCELDTLAMVMILEYFLDEVGWP